MTVNQFLTPLDAVCKIIFKDMDNNEICTCSSDSAGVEPYKDRKIVGWVPYFTTIRIIEIMLGDEE